MYLFDEFEVSHDVLSSGTSVGRLSTCDASWCSLSIIGSIRIDYINLLNNTFKIISYLNYSNDLINYSTRPAGYCPK